MMQEYLKMKEDYRDCILMYRIGDFYEMFFDDAKTERFKCGPFSGMGRRLAPRPSASTL